MSGDPIPAKADPLAAETPAVPAAMTEPVPAPPAVPGMPGAAATPAAPGVPATTAAPEAPAPPLVPPVPVAPATPAASAEAAPPSRRRLALLAGFGRIVRFIVMVALLVAGVALGSASFQRSQPPAPVAGDPVTAGIVPPPIVQEFVTALASNDPDSIRSAVPTDPYKLLAAELQRWDFATVTSVETLSTLDDGPRSSTAIVLIGHTSGGNPVSINLIVHADAGKIVSFR
jgi:hypothetical protein